MSLILQIETATTACSVAIAENGNVLACKEVNERNIHAEAITVFIDEVITSAKVSYQNLDAIAVSCGPGSYTGLRIGISTVKGLCFALDKPLIAIETLAAMADGMLMQDNYTHDANTLLCPMVDARRMEVFTAIFNAAGDEVKPAAAEIIDQNSFGDLLDAHKIVFFGDGAEKCRAVLADKPNAIFYEGFVNSARHLTKRASQKFAGGHFEDVAYFEPYYLKDFIAGQKK